jgi:hypothetical protein
MDLPFYNLLFFYLIYFLSYLGFLLKKIAGYEYKELEARFCKIKSLNKIFLLDLRYLYLFMFIVYIVYEINFIQIFIIFFIFLLIIKNSIKKLDKSSESAYLIITTISLIIVEFII